MSFKTPLGRVLGHGSAKSGTEHFWRQRVTGAANLLLSIWFIVTVLCLLGGSHTDIVETFSHPVQAALMILFIASFTTHMRLGMQVVIEDYVHTPLWKYSALIANIFFSYGIAAISILSVLILAFRG